MKDLEPTEPLTREGARKAGGLWATVGFSLVTLWYTWPLGKRLSTHMVGGHNDGPMFLWNFWWGGQAWWRAGGTPLHTQHLFHPEGTSLVVNTHAVGAAVLGAPLQWMFGLVPAFNLEILLTYVLSGLGTYLLAFELIRDRRAAFVAGTAFAFCHFRTSLILFLNLAQTQFMMLTLWALWRAARTGSRRSAALAGLFGAALLYSSYNLAVITALMGLLLILFAEFGARHERAKASGWIVRWLVLLLVFTVLSAPLFLELRAEVARHGWYTTLSAPASDTVTPLDRYLDRDALQSGGEASLREACYLGVVVLALAGLGVVAFWRRLLVWLLSLLALGFVALSLGPVLEWRAGEGPGWTMPFALVRDWPLVGEIRIAHRYGIAGALALALLSGFGARALLQFLTRLVPSRPALGVMGACVLAAIVALDFAPRPFPKLFRLPEIPESIDAIRDDVRDVCVMQFPAGRRGYKLFSYYQTRHGKPVYLDGEIARRIPALEEAQARSTLREALAAAFAGQRLPGSYLREVAPRVATEVREHRIGWLALSFIDFEGNVLGRQPVPEDRLVELQRVVRRLLPDAELIFRVEDEEALGWADRRRAARLSANCLYAVYRIPLADE